MGSFSLMHWVIVLLVIMLLFGGGRISGMMGDVAKGIKSFKKGLEDDDDEPKMTKPATKIEAQPTVTPTPVHSAEETKQG
ncbi:MAG: twin-arginine translocase TatA/TatE family subunit [Sphingobium sp.]|nr:twin-arginine translocase TatA/TatE family subunit [Sphingobium sp.]